MVDFPLSPEPIVTSVLVYSTIIHNPAYPAVESCILSAVVANLPPTFGLLPDSVSSVPPRPHWSSYKHPYLLIVECDSEIPYSTLPDQSQSTQRKICQLCIFVVISGGVVLSAQICAGIGRAVFVSCIYCGRGGSYDECSINCPCRLLTR